MPRGVTNVASSTTSKKYAEVPGATQSMPLKSKLHEQEICIKTININSNNFYCNHSAIANLKTSSNKATFAVPYKVGTGHNGNLMPLNIFTILFPCKTADQLAAKKDATKLRTYNCTTITQWGRCKVEIENNNKWKIAFSL